MLIVQRSDEQRFFGIRFRPEIVILTFYFNVKVVDNTLNKGLGSVVRLEFEPKH